MNEMTMNMNMNMNGDLVYFSTGTSVYLWVHVRGPVEAPGQSAVVVLRVVRVVHLSHSRGYVPDMRGVTM